MFGLEEYYNGLLIEAKSPEEIKKILEYQFVQGKGVPQNVLDYVFSIDPTNKKTYTRWVLMQWENSQNTIVEAVKNGKLQQLFNTFKERETSGLNLVSMPSIEKAMEYVKEPDPILDGNQDKSLPENQYEVVFNSAEWAIAVPHTFEADKKLGMGCKWCTAGAFGENDNSWWRKYSAIGPLWVNFDKREKEIGPKDRKEYPYKRYQFLFEFRNGYGEMMDANDCRINFEEINMPEDVIEFYRSKNPEYIKTLERCINYDNEDGAWQLDANDGWRDEDQAWEEYNEERYNLKIQVFDNLYLAPEQNDDMNLECPYRLYEEDDFSDSPVEGTFDKDNCIVDSCDDYALLKRTDGVYVFCDYEDYFVANFARDFDNVMILLNASLMIIVPESENENGWTVAKIRLNSYNGIADILVNGQITQLANEHSMNGLAIEVCYKGSTSITDNSHDSLNAIGMKKNDYKKYYEHCLLWYNGEQIVTIIPQDIPLDDMFTAVFENGRLLIQSSGKQYPLKNRFYEQKQITETFNRIYKSIIDAELHRYDD